MDLSAQELESLFGTAPTWITSLAELIAGSWSALLGHEIEVTALSADAGEASKPGSAALRVETQLGDCQQPLSWEVDRRLAAALIDAQVGADEVSPARTHGVLTEIEQALVMRVLETARLAFNSQPTSERDLSLGPLTIVSSAAEATASPVLAIAFHVRALGTTGQCTWRLHAEHQRCLAPAEPQVTRKLTAVLAEFTLPSADLADLAVGDIIATDVEANSPVTLVDESGIAVRATLGRLGEFRAVQVMEE